MVQVKCCGFREMNQRHLVIQRRVTSLAFCHKPHGTHFSGPECRHSAIGPCVCCAVTISGMEGGDFPAATLPRAIWHTCSWHKRISPSEYTNKSRNRLECPITKCKGNHQQAPNSLQPQGRHRPASRHRDHQS